MNRPSRFAPPFRLGEWTVQPALNRVSGPRGDVRLEPRVMAVLLRLAAAPGQVVGRLDLLDEIWGDTVVGEEILTRAISELRRVFGDRAREPRYIETIINNGYRLIAPVEVLPEPAAAPHPATPPAAPAGGAEPDAAPIPPLLRRSLVTVALLALAMILVAIATRWYPARDGAVPAHLPAAGARAQPLTAFPGHERQPAVTADGLRVAFAWAGPEGDAEGIWVKQRNSETPLRLSGGPGVAAWPAWSPDGQTVAWVQLRGGVSEIRTVPSIGGAERTLLTVPGPVVGLDWAPDGARLVFAARDTATGRHRLRRLDPETLEVGDLNPGGAVPAGEVQPRCSPDGSRLAWIRLGADGTSSLWWSDRDGLGRHELLAGFAGLAGLAWSADGQVLIAGIDHAGTYGLWAVPLAAGEGQGPRRLTGATEFAWNPAVAAGTGELVYEQVRVDQDLWRIRILGREPWQLETSRFLASTRWEYEAEYSPDGNLVAVVSARSGTPEIWLCDPEGGNLRQLTDTGEAALARPRWSADGRSIVFTIRDWEGTDVGRVPAAGGPVARGAAYDRPEGPQVPGPAPADRDAWRVVGGEAFGVVHAAGEAFLMIRDLQTGRDAIVTDLPGFAGTGLAVAPGGSAVLYPRLGPAEGDLMRLVNP
ncbi:MAG: winged helix-turn-helix domain-containing protein [Candidatus Krumholzibacteriia bacterium]